ncbi:NAD(P)-dependent alcohol dehydrogenase [Marinomonas hwangdonensis]|uniref:NAD(P)-dependent alcohol dehydrogenase n=1 Tax=Marinomonas hwangdonensis TaxID=1053647 RepID=A0A3M8Q9E8_9GAMM|nr:NAD(P)-dependent alcohol dehydrogenase [Marinomonas hwangdonensis]RNF51690.1 NAD(P)-dependent alcohol dehydrogenase [Marinomonas hwangdonensis]
MSQAKSYAALSATTPLVPFSFERRALREDDVNIDILYCGVCHSDIHIAESDWGPSEYPVVPGHEIIGRVMAVGNKVSQYKVGDIVGVGCMVDSCQHCSHCAADLEQYCQDGPVGTYGAHDLIDGTLTYGGYSDHIVVREKFVLTIPSVLNISKAAPLLCAGITTYSPLRHHGVKAGDKVGILGMGGLGHMGVKFAKALGAEVTIFTRSESKVAEAKKQGADHVIVSTDEAQMQAAAFQFDYLLDTIPVQHDLNPYLNCLKVDGTHILVGLIEPMNPPVHSANLVIKRRVLTGSLIGGIAETQEMLDFCAQHDIECDAEMISIQDINQAYQRLKQGNVKYRFIIDMQSLKNLK